MRTTRTKYTVENNGVIGFIYTNINVDLYKDAQDAKKVKLRFHMSERSQRETIDDFAVYRIQDCVKDVSTSTPISCFGIYSTPPPLHPTKTFNGLSTNPHKVC